MVHHLLARQLPVRSIHHGIEFLGSNTLTQATLLNEPKNALLMILERFQFLMAFHENDVEAIRSLHNS